MIVSARATQAVPKITAVETIAFHMEVISHRVQEAKVSRIREAKVLTEFEATQLKDGARYVSRLD